MQSITHLRSERRDKRDEVMKKRGFTIAELLIVVAIIAVLVGISIPIFIINFEKSKIAVDKANIRACYADASYEFISKDWDGSEKTFTEGNVVCSGTVVDTVVKIVYVSGARSNLIHDASQVYFEGGAFVVDGVEK